MHTGPMTNLANSTHFSIDELKRLHGVMTYLTVDESGQFRRGEEGVFDGARCIFMAPPQCAFLP